MTKRSSVPSRDRHRRAGRVRGPSGTDAPAMLFPGTLLGENAAARSGGGDGRGAAGGRPRTSLGAAGDGQGLPECTGGRPCPTAPSGTRRAVGPRADCPADGRAAPALPELCPRPAGGPGPRPVGKAVAEELHWKEKISSK